MVDMGVLTNRFRFCILDVGVYLTIPSTPVHTIAVGLKLVEPLTGYRPTSHYSRKLSKVCED